MSKRDAAQLAKLVAHGPLAKLIGHYGARVIAERIATMVSPKRRGRKPWGIELDIVRWGSVQAKRQHGIRSASAAAKDCDSGGYRTYTSAYARIEKLRKNDPELFRREVERAIAHAREEYCDIEGTLEAWRRGGFEPPPGFLERLIAQGEFELPRDMVAAQRELDRNAAGQAEDQDD
jgi:hypothetical protein